MNRDRLEELLLASSAGELGEEERTALNAMLRESQKARACAARFLATDALLADALETDSTERSFATKDRRRLVVRVSAAAAAAAAAAIVLVTALALNLLTPPDEKARVVAVMAGEELEVGRVLAIADGEAKIKFDSGALLAVEAPAKLEILGENAARLHSGVATVRVPGPIKGFELETPAKTVVDLGTSFGVTVDGAGNSVVTVFEGEVAVGDRDAPERIFAGHAVRMNKERGRPSEEISYNPAPFQRTWESSFGIEGLQGDVRFARPGERKSPGAVVDRDSLLLIPEREGVWLPANMPLNIVEPGTHVVPYFREGFLNRKGQRVAKEIVLSKSTQVDSYLLQYNPGLPSPTSEGRPFVTEVQFDREVVGIVAQKDLLAEYDPLVALPKADFTGQRNRGVAQNDRIILDEDRRTIRVAFDIQDGVDQIRVLVASHLSNRLN